MNRSEVCRKSAINRWGEFGREELRALRTRLNDFLVQCDKEEARMKARNLNDSVRIDGATKADRAFDLLEDYFGKIEDGINLATLS